MRILSNTTALSGIFLLLSCAYAEAREPNAGAENPAANEELLAQNADSSFDKNGNLIMPPVVQAPVVVQPDPDSEIPPPPVDKRIKQLVYNEGDVYTITTRYGYQTNIVISSREDIETISVGDKSVWQIIPAGNRIFIRPMEEDVITNMTILTSRHSYQFDLKSLPAGEKEGNIYVAQFIYPEDMEDAASAIAAPAPPPSFDANGNPIANGNLVGVKAAVNAPAAPVNPDLASEAFEDVPTQVAEPMPPPVTSNAVRAAEPLPANVPFGGPTPPPQAAVVQPAPKASAATTLAQMNAAPPPPTQYIEVPSSPNAVAAAVPVAPRAEVAAVPANANFNYTYTGADDLAPLQVFDDGRKTWLKYNALGPVLPDVYVLDAAGNVTSVAHEAQGDFMVVDAIVPEMIVKNANGSIHVYNESLAPQQ